MGMHDPLMFTFERSKKLREQREKHKDSLGEAIISSEDAPNERVFGTRMSHRIPFYRENEWKRWDAVAQVLRELKK